jgi:hypothetical protein
MFVICSKLSRCTAGREVLNDISALRSLASPVLSFWYPRVRKLSTCLYIRTGFEGASLDTHSSHSWCCVCRFAEELRFEALGVFYIRSCVLESVRSHQSEQTRGEADEMHLGVFSSVKLVSRTCGLISFSGMSADEARRSLNGHSKPMNP